VVDAPTGFVLSLILCFLVSTFFVGVAFSSSGTWNWVEVARTTGDICNLYETKPFNISSSVSVWRIVWEYTPRTDVPENRTGIAIYLYRGASGDDKIIEIGRTGLNNGNEDARYYHEEGVFRLKINGNTQNFTVIVEENIESVPEFPSWTILPLLSVATLIGVTVRNKTGKKGSE
jgi:hypothetical protein